MQRRKERGPRHDKLHGACIFFGLLNGLLWWFKEVRMLLLSRMPVAARCCESMKACW